MPEFPLEKIREQIKSDPEMLKLAKDDPTEFDARVANVYNEFGYRPDGSAIPAAQMGMRKLSKATGIPEGVVQFAAAAPIPIATTLMGAAAGTVAGGPGAGTGLGAMFGSLSGEEINARLGITDPLTSGEQAIAMGAPLLGPLAMRGKGLMKGVMQRLPGAQAGVHELAGEAFEESLKKIRVTDVQVNMARSLAEKAPDVKMELPGLRALLKAEQGGARLRAEFPGQERYGEVLQGFIDEMGKGPMTMKKILAWEKGANLAKISNPTEVWSKMAGTIIGDMEQAALNPKLSQASRMKISESLDAFKMMVQVSRKYRADEALDGIFKRVVTPLADDPSLLQFNKRTFVRELKNNEALKGAFSSREIEDIKETVEGIGYISKNVTHLMQKYSTQGAALAVGAAAMGVPVGTAIPAVLVGNEIIRRGLMSDTGRKVIKYLSKQGQGKIDLGDLDTMLGKMAVGAGVTTAAGLKATEEMSPFKPMGEEQ